MRPNSFLKLGSPAVRIHTMKCSKKMRSSLLTVCHVEPLLWNIVSVRVLPFYVGLPSNVAGIDLNRCVVGIIKRVKVSEDSLRDETARDCRSGWVGDNRNICVEESSAFIKIWVLNNRRAVFCDLFNCSILAGKLFRVFRLDITSVVLIEVIKLVVDVNRSFYSFFNF